MIELSRDTVQARYKTKAVENKTEGGYALRSFIWKNINGNWRILFHQGTLMHKDLTNKIKEGI